jgi:DNA polymerase I-like protein with 3'-5' exonuclease and polymerase domains
MTRLRRSDVSDDFDPQTVSWVLDKAALRDLLGAIDSCEEVFLDLETTGLDEHESGRPTWPVKAQIVLASLTLVQEGDGMDHAPTTWVVPLSHPDSPFLGQWRLVMKLIAQQIVKSDRPVSNQNMKFDSRWTFAHTGIDLSTFIAWDTQSGAHLLDETSSTKLKVRVPAVFDVERWDDFDLSTPGAALKVPVFDLGLYAARDTYWTWRWAELQRIRMFLHPDTRDLEPEGPEEVEAARLGRLATWCAMPTVKTLTAVEQRGMRLDVDWVNEQLQEYELASAGIGAELAHRYPEVSTEGYSFAPTSKWFATWSEAAVDAGDLRVTALTATGRPQWDKGVLLRQARRGSTVARDLLEYRSAIKRSEYLRSYLAHVTPDGFIHTTYNAARVITGRLSSDSPNMQQVTAALKAAFMPSRRGRVLMELDQSQIELRIAAFISRCPAMLEAFAQGLDLHKLLALRILQLGEDTAARVENRPAKQLTLEDVTAIARQSGKSANFGLLYLMGPAGFQRYAETVYDIAFTVEEAQLIHQAFYQQWIGIGPWHTKQIARARATGQVVSPIGRVRRLPGIYDSHPDTAAYNERAAVNAPVQGFGSDVMQIGAALIEGTIPGTTRVEDAYLIGTVHDSIIVEAEEDRWEEVAAQCVDRMTDGVLWVLRKMDCELDVPLAVEGKVGTRWGLADIGKVAS